MRVHDALVDDDVRTNRADRLYCRARLLAGTNTSLNAAASIVRQMTGPARAPSQWRAYARQGSVPLSDVGHDIAQTAALRLGI